jgi:exonuclease SbcD
MKILHTADWHLGHKLYNADRELEHQTALDGLIQLIKKEKVELLVIAGDVFDTDMPPNFARRQYYRFLVELTKTACKDVVVVAGNHDSANMLDASSELLKLMNVHVVGNLPTNRSDQIIEIKDEENQLKAVVAAVPYLRDRDMRQGQAGQTIEERLTSLRAGIEAHYAEIDELLETYKDLEIPILVTGHLFVSGGERDGRPNSIHIGSLDVVESSVFPKNADYVALGHLHRPQKVGGMNHIRYSGSLIPMDFNEWNYDQVSLLLNFEGKDLKSVKSKKVNLSRKLKFYRGELDYIRDKLSNLEVEGELPTWLKLEIITDSYIPNVEDDLKPLLEQKNAEIMLVSQLADGSLASKLLEEQQLQNLSDMDPREVFQMKLDAMNVKDKSRDDLEDTFAELLTWMQEKDQD